MKRLWILILVPFLFAGRYAVEKNGQVTDVIYVGGSDSLSDVLNDMGIEDGNIKAISENDLPSREDRDFWKLNDVPIGDKIVIDQAKKSTHDASETAKENRKRALASKMGLNWDEVREAKDLGLL